MIARFTPNPEEYPEYSEIFRSLDRQVGMTARRQELRKDWWIGFDLDGTLAEEIYGSYRRPGILGVPIKRVADLFKCLHFAYPGHVKIFTARVCDPTHPECMYEEISIKNWCEYHFKFQCPVTAVKDYACRLIIDDRAMHVMSSEMPTLPRSFYEESPLLPFYINQFVKDRP